MRAKSVVGVLMSLALMFISCPVQPASAASATYYVATTGDDANPGTSALPFRTIQKAAEILSAGDTVVIRSGTYRETVTPANSGTSGQPITFQAEAGAVVTVSGTEELGGWTQHSGSIYKANLSTLKDLKDENQLFAGGGAAAVPLWEARWPNIGVYSFPELRKGMANMQGGSGTSITDSALTQPDGFWNGASVWVRGGHGYLAQTTTVDTFSASDHTLHIAAISDNADYLNPAAGNDYFLSGILGALDAPGEWYVDSAAGEIYLWAPGGGVPAGVEIKQRINAFDLSDRSYIHLTGIQTFAANIKMGASDGNVLDGVQANYLYFSDVSQGYYPSRQDDGGIVLAGSNNEIKNSRIGYSSGTLIKIQGNQNRVVNNEIHDGDFMGSYTSLIVMENGTENLISHNTLRDAGRASIYWKAGNANVEYNDIYNGMWLSRDGGMIYCYGTDLGNSEIHHNIIHDNKAYSSGFNLYLDNFTENAVIHHNVIYGGDTGLVFNTPGNFKLVYNNTIVDNKESFSFWGPDPYSQELYGTRMFNNIMTDAVSLTPDVVSGNNITDGAGVNFADPASHKYRILAGSTAADIGIVVPGVTETYKGSAPDAGAYEIGGPDWKAGHDFANPPNPVYMAVNTPYMNLIKNSGFEWGMTGWEGSSTGKTVEVNGEPAWEYRGAFNKLRLGGGADGVEQTVTGLKPNTTYKLTGWLYNDAGEGVNIGIKNYGGGEQSAYSEDKQYVRREVEFTTGPDNTSVLVYVYKSSEGAGYSYADDMGLVETTPMDQYDPKGLKQLQLASPSFVLKEGETGTLTLTGTLQSGDPADLSPADYIYFKSSDPATVLIECVRGATVAEIKAVKPGQAVIKATVSLNGITKAITKTITVFPKKPDVKGLDWKVSAFGPTGKGFVLADQAGNLSLYGQGANVWGASDDFVFLNQKVKLDDPSATVTMTATFAAFDTKSPDAAVGLMFRAKDSVDSKHVHFRLDGLGGLRYVYRNAESIADAQKPADQQNYWGSATGVLKIWDKSVRLPAKLKLVKQGNLVTGFYDNGDGWVEMGSTTCEFSGSELLAGVGLYAGKDAAPVKAQITDLKVTVEK